MKWTILSTIKEKDILKRRREISKQLLENRNLRSESEQQIFLNPVDPMTIKAADVGILDKELDATLGRIKKAIENNEKIVIYGDYDADGITATAILWETLSYLKADVWPFIPNREKHGYGLSIKGLDEVIDRYKPKLIITVDNGIVANEAADYIKSKGIDLIITDHHQKGAKIPECFSLLHTDSISGAGVAWFLAKELSEKEAANTLDLVAIGTVADVLPLIGVNRSLVRYGLEVLSSNKRPGILALFEEALLDNASEITTYHINYVIAPRLNAMGRLFDAHDSLRLLCTKNNKRATELAHLLGSTNRSRQDLTQDFLNKAHSLVIKPLTNLLIVEDKDFHEGVIGLVAGKLAETYYRPSIIISRGETVSKASARSVKGVNIIEMIRRFDSLLINAGGHPMAAGFTIETVKIEEFSKTIVEYAQKEIADELLVPEIRIDCEIAIEDVNWDLYNDTESLKPFGMGNPQPIYAIRGVEMLNAKLLGRDGKHLKLLLKDEEGKLYSAVGFSMGERYTAMKDKKRVDLAFSLNENVWNNHRELQMILKDIVF